MSVSWSCLCCVKYLMFVFNLIFWLGGCGLFGVGVWLSFTQSEFSSLPLSFPSLSAANLLLTAGGITMVTGFLGCLGALKEQRCLMFMFFVILLLLVLTEVSLILIIHIFHDKLDSKAQGELKEGMKIYESEPGLKKSWDSVQKMFKCCGVTNKTDWYEVLNGSLPSSCCSIGTDQCINGWSEEETTSLQEYIKKMAPTDQLLSKCLRQQKPSKEEEPEGLSWKDKPMHGMYHRQIEEVADIEKTYQWLGKSQTERQHRGTTHGCTRTGPEHQNNRGRGLPYQTRPQVQTVWRCT
ncbi:Tetraspanin-9 [Takifugu flavidus]|uniref:Tetraspanin-9 n=1 Tax=Takifugu flavidus TaxID=433684 RepID=A0A5C6NFP6_9TELE|nr:Tetraspanin-9 [Takifugu flavidus]